MRCGFQDRMIEGVWRLEKMKGFREEWSDGH